MFQIFWKCSFLFFFFLYFFFFFGKGGQQQAWRKSSIRVAFNFWDKVFGCSRGDETVDVGDVDGQFRSLNSF